MKKILFVLSFMVFMVSCETKHTKPIHHIDFNKIEKVTVKANSKLIPTTGGDSVRGIPLEKVKPVIDNINKSIGAGKIVFMPRVYLTIHFKDKTSRAFTLTGDIIKEKLEDTQEIRIPDYADTIWAMGVKE